MFNEIAQSSLARRAVRLYPHSAVSNRHAVNHLRRGWIRQIQYLGDKWILAKSVPKRSES